MTNQKLNTNFTAYDQNDIDTWTRSLYTIPQEIEKEQQNIPVYNAALEKLKKQLSDVNPSAAPHELRIGQLLAQKNSIINASQVTSLTSKATDLDKEIKIKKAQLVEVENTIANYNTVIRQIERRIEYKRIDDCIRGLENSKQRMVGEIATLQNNLLAKNTEALTLQQRINSLEANISKMRQADRDLRASIHHHGFKTSAHPHDLGFGSTLQQQNGFESSMDQNSGFKSSMHQENGFSSTQHQDHGFKTSLTTGFEEDPIVGRRQHEHHREAMDSHNVLEIELQQLRGKEALLKTSIEMIKTDIANKQVAINSANSDIQIQQGLKLLYGIHEISSANGMNIFQLELELANIKSAKLTNTQEKTALENSLAILNRKANQTATEITSLQDTIRVYANRRGDYDKINDLSTLDTLLDKEAQSEPIKQKRSLEDQINSQQAAIDQSKYRIQSLQNNLHELKTNDFKQKITQHPAKLISDLIANTQNVLSQYEAAHPAQQSDKVRVALVNLLEHLQAIQNIPMFESAYRDLVGDVPAEQQRYIQYCGMLWVEFNELNKDLNAEDIKLAEAILAILKANPIKSGTAITEYDNLALPRCAIDEVKTREKSAYGVVLKVFTERLNPYKNAPHKDQKQLYKSGIALLDSTVAHLAKKGKEQAKPGTLKFYTNMLQTAVQLMKEPSNEKLQKALHFLIEQSSDQPPIGQRILKSLTTGFGLFGDKNVDVETAGTNFEKDFKNVKHFIPVVNTSFVLPVEEKAVPSHPSTLFSTTPTAPPVEPTDEGYVNIYPDLSLLKYNQ